MIDWRRGVARMTRRNQTAPAAAIEAIAAAVSLPFHEGARERELRGSACAPSSARRSSTCFSPSAAWPGAGCSADAASPALRESRLSAPVGAAELRWRARTPGWK